MLQRNSWAPAVPRAVSSPFYLPARNNEGYVLCVTLYSTFNDQRRTRMPRWRQRQNPRLSPTCRFISRASDFLHRGKTIVVSSRSESSMNGGKEEISHLIRAPTFFLQLRLSYHPSFPPRSLVVFFLLGFLTFCPCLGLLVWYRKFSVVNSSWIRFDIRVEV